MADLTDSGSNHFGPGFSIKEKSDQVDHPIQEKKSWDEHYSERYSPAYDPNNAAPETGRSHEWVYRDGSGYYDNIYECRVCKERNWGWNLWREDWEPVCTGENNVG